MSVELTGVLGILMVLMLVLAVFAGVTYLTRNWT